jgi:hypothetical protein
LSFLLVKSEILVTIYLRLNALLCMSQEYFLPPAMHGNDDIMFIEIYFEFDSLWFYPIRARTHDLPHSRRAC